MAYFELKQMTPGEKRGALGMRGCYECELLWGVVGYVNWYLRKYLRRNKSFVPTVTQIVQCHVVGVELVYGDKRLWMWSLHKNNKLSSFFGGVWSILRFVFKVNERVGNIPIVYGEFGWQYRLEFSDNEFRVNVISPSGFVCKIEGLEEIIEFLLNLFAMLEISETEVNSDVL